MPEARIPILINYILAQEWGWVKWFWKGMLTENGKKKIEKSIFDPKREFVFGWKTDAQSVNIDIRVVTELIKQKTFARQYREQNIKIEKDHTNIEKMFADWLFDPYNRQKQKRRSIWKNQD